MLADYSVPLTILVLYVNELMAVVKILRILELNGPAQGVIFGVIQIKRAGFDATKTSIYQFLVSTKSVDSIYIIIQR